MVTGGLLTLLFGVPLAAALSDRIGRRPVMLAGVIAQLLLAWPLFAIATNHRPWQLRGFEILFALAQSMVSGPLAAMLAERDRATRATSTDSGSATLPAERRDATLDSWKQAARSEALRD